MSDSKKENLFAKLAQQNARAVQAEAAAEPTEENTPPSPALTASTKQSQSTFRKKPEPIRGKRENPDYCQANAYVLKSVRRAVDRALLDIEGLDYSSLVEDLLRKWLKARGISE